MQTVLNPDYKTGIFKRELKNRFLCEVDIDGESTVCYVPSSCHLSNFLTLHGKKVILMPTQSKATRTKYALFAVPYKKSYILLNTTMANRAVEGSIGSRMFSYLGKRKSICKEHYIEGYKSDLFIRDTNTIIEIKSVLSLKECASFPTLYSERSLAQLEKLRDLVDMGYHVHYTLVSLNPYVKSISLIRTSHFAELLYDCINQGLTISAYTCAIKDNRIIIKHRIPIEMGEIYHGE